MSDNKSPLFNADQHALENEYQKCPDCGQSLIIKNGKAGAFIGCSTYPVCSYTRPLHPETDEFESKLIPDSHCPKCQSQLAVKNGRYGMFIGCSNFPACDHIEHDNPIKDEQTVTCPNCKKGQIAKRTSRHGKAFYACDQYPRCKYLINFEPVELACPACDWPIMVKKTLRGEGYYLCPQKKCGHKIKQN